MTRMESRIKYNAASKSPDIVSAGIAEMKEKFCVNGQGGTVVVQPGLPLFQAEGCNWVILENMTVQVNANEAERVVLLKTTDVKNIMLKNVYLRTDSPYTSSLEDFLDIEPETNFIKTYSLLGWIPDGE